MRTIDEKVFFFDIGGVLLTNGWGHVSREKAAKKFNLNQEEFDVLHHFIFNVFEIGHISLDEYLETVIFCHPRDFTKKEFKDFMFSESVELPDMLPWLKKWKAENGTKVFALNNEGKELNDFRIKKFKLYEVFDGFISSGEVGVRKPDPRIYQLAMSMTHTLPENSYYFDDREMLTNTAKKLGMNAFHHTHFEETKAYLESLVS